MMTRVLSPVITTVVAVALASTPARGLAGPPQETAEALMTGESGGALFKTYCASCHGTAAKGDGPLAQHLRVRPPDLTLFAKRSGGKFDTDKVQRIIDGRHPLKGHGGADMPVWGDAFQRSGKGLSEEAVKARIKGLADFLEGIQAK